MIALWADAHASKLTSREDIATALMAAYNMGLEHAREACEEAEKQDCKSAQQIAIVRSISTACLHGMVLDGDTMEPVALKPIDETVK